MKPDLETPAYQADISSSKPNNYIFPMPCFEIYIHEHEKKKQEKKNGNISMKEQRETVVHEQSYLTTYMVNECSSIYIHGIFYMDLYFTSLSPQLLRAFLFLTFVKYVNTIVFIFHHICICLQIEIIILKEGPEQYTDTAILWDMFPSIKDFPWLRSQR